MKRAGPEMESGAGPSEVRNLCSGATVRLHGLKGASHLNGEVGICGEWDDAANRWIVRLSGAGELKSLRPENLEVEISEAPADEESDGEVVDPGRMASDPDIGFVCCQSLAAARQALDGGERRLEFSGVTDERDACLDLVSELLRKEDSQLHGISFAGCGLSAECLSKLATALREGAASPHLQAFGVSKNPGVAGESWRELFTVLPSDLVWVDFGDNLLSDADMAPLLEALSGREELDKFYVDGNRLCDLSTLCDALPDTGITNLDLGDNDISDDQLDLLSSVLSKSVVMILVLGKNPITAKGATMLLEKLPRTSIDALYLDNTGVDDDCLKLLGLILKDSKISELHLDSTKITDVGVRELIQFVGDSEITYLDITDNDVSEETSQLLVDTVSKAQEGENAS